MKVLIIDNNIDRDSWGSPDLRALASSLPGATVYVRRGPAGDLPWDYLRYDRIVLSGSKTSCLEEAPWISSLDAMIKDLMDRGRPLLGVCYGHQAIARVLGGRQLLRKSDTPEFGWTQVERVADSVLTQGLPESFYTYSSHFEEIAELPRGLKRLAKSERCAIQAFQLEGRPIFGIQFHPEKGFEDAEKALLKRKQNGDPGPLLRMGEGGKLFNPKIGETLFRNFLSL